MPVISARSSLPLFLLLVVSALWGTSFILLKIASTSLGPVAIAAARAGLAAILLLPVSYRHIGRIGMESGLWLRLICLSLFGQILPFSMLAIAAPRLSTALLAAMMGLAPIFTFVLARVLPPRERWSIPSLTGVLIGASGLAIVVWAPSSSGGLPDSTGVLCALFAAIGYGAGAVCSRPLTMRLGSSATTVLSMSLTTVSMTVAWRFQHPAGFSAGGLSVQAIAAVLVLGICNTAGAYVAFFKLVSLAGPTFAGLSNYLVPPMGALAGALWYRDDLSIKICGALCLILGGAAIASGGSPRRRPTEITQDR